jgi:protein-S-isoprenylcysteine O-methyltransferase Ste14
MWRLVAEWAMTFDKDFNIVLPEWTIYCAVPVLGAGIVLTVICLFQFATDGQGTFVHFDAPAKFVASGAYKYSRNPMYLGVLLIFSGYALLYHSVAVLVLTLLLFLFAHIIVVVIEEPALQNKFGQDYINYKNTVGRWIAGVKK